MVVRTSLRFELRPFLFCYPIPYHFPATRCASERRHPAHAITMSSRLLRNGSTVTRKEEELPDYHSEDFYPVRLGDVFKSRYQVIAKLGFGVGSSIWLCRDLKFGNYLTLKVCTCRQEAGVAAQSTNEVAVARHIRAANIKHPGKRYFRLIIREFTIYGPGGEHRCLLYMPQGMTYTEFRNSQPDRMLNKTLLQQTYQLILIGLDLLHQLSVVHTDISPNNILLGARSPSVFSKIEQSELEHRRARKCFDFGGARIGERKHLGDVMSDFYRAPEVILGMEWDCKIDIWSIGVLVWDLFEGGRLFYALKNCILDDEQRLAEMVALMGPPPHKYWHSEDIPKPNPAKVAMNNMQKPTYAFMAFK
ncbi:protein kinase [Histoplasma capsulatum]|uniref:EKC/KEOPS complex subunit BUD32 n=1 Tax=Ajellomyces capsulatus TaxID=5037 RepID=A0A8A1M683_AJECA|nr:protein kinase [Histoplasma capsulatum]